LVAAGQGVALVPQLATGGLPSGVRLLPLPTRRRTRIAFRQGAADHPAVAAFIAATCRSGPDRGPSPRVLSGPG
jgi:DNA-binding transcriptional LysR family regulator